MRSILAGTLSGIGAAFVTRFVDGFFNSIAAAIVTGAVIGAAVAFGLRPKDEVK